MPGPEDRERIWRAQLHPRKTPLPRRRRLRRSLPPLRGVGRRHPQRGPERRAARRGRAGRRPPQDDRPGALRFRNRAGARRQARHEAEPLRAARRGLVANPSDPGLPLALACRDPDPARHGRLPRLGVGAAVVPLGRSSNAARATPPVLLTPVTSRYHLPPTSYHLPPATCHLPSWHIDCSTALGQGRPRHAATIRVRLAILDSVRRGRRPFPGMPSQRERRRPGARRERSRRRSSRSSPRTSEPRPSRAVQVNVTNGVVTLAGPVHNEDEKTRAESSARSVEGVVSVDERAADLGGAPASALTAAVSTPAPAVTSAPSGRHPDPLTPASPPPRARAGTSSPGPRRSDRPGGTCAVDSSRRRF